MACLFYWEKWNGEIKYSSPNVLSEVKNQEVFLGEDGLNVVCWPISWSFHRQSPQLNESLKCSPHNQKARADSSEWREVHIKSSSTLSQMMLNFYWTLDNGSSELINLLFLDPWMRWYFIQFADAERVLLGLCLVLGSGGLICKIKQAINLDQNNRIQAYFYL